MRKSVVFFFQLVLAIVLFVGHPTFASTPAQADQLIQQGFQSLDRGLEREALSQWRAAEAAYRRLNDDEGIVGSQVDQSLALKQLGFYSQAYDILTHALRLKDEFPLKESLDLENLSRRVAPLATSPARIAGLTNLGEVLRVVGQLDAAQVVLSAAAKPAPTIAPDLSPAITLALADIEQDRAFLLLTRYSLTDDRAITTQLLLEVQARVEAALKLYQQVESPGRRTLAQINALGLLVNLQTWLSQQSGVTIVQMQQQVIGVIAQRLPQIQNVPFDGLSPIRSIYARIKLVSLLAEVQPLAAKTLAQRALQIAEDLGNKRAQSFALGALAQLEPNAGGAMPLYQNAVELARASQSWDASYRWERSLGAIYQQQGDPDTALQFYTLAVQDLDWVRSNLRSVNADVQFSFRDQVEPVYRGVRPQFDNTKKPQGSHIG